LIDWCLTPTLAVVQLYRGANKFYIFDNLNVNKIITCICFFSKANCTAL